MDDIDRAVKALAVLIDLPTDNDAVYILLLKAIMAEMAGFPQEAEEYADKARAAANQEKESAA